MVAPSPTPPANPAPTKPSALAQPVQESSAAAPTEPAPAAPVDSNKTLTADTLSVPPPILKAPKATKNEVAISGDFMFGDGTVSLPLGYSLKKSLNSSATPVGAFTVPRNSAFTLDDTYYQLYLRYAFPQLRGKRFSAYLRVGVSYVTATLTDNASSPALGRYKQDDSTTDILGNLGFGLGYSLFSRGRFRLGLQGDLEGFYGERSQNTTESLPADVGVNFVSANINNSLYGIVGRVTLRAEYRLGHNGLFKLFGDVGAQGQYTAVDYPGAGTKNEDVYGLYGKLGLRYSF
jgi:hypothetical protein